VVAVSSAWLDHNTNAAEEEEDAADADIVDTQLRVKLMMAESSGRLDLTDCRLPRLPRAVLRLKGLEVGL
jgi:hypothetical protein